MACLSKRSLLILPLVAAVVGCILFDPDANVRPVCQQIADDCDQDTEDVDECEENGREARQFRREQGDDCIELLQAENALNDCVLRERDVDCNFFITFDGCEDEFEELIDEAIEAGSDCQQ